MFVTAHESGGAPQERSLGMGNFMTTGRIISLVRMIDSEMPIQTLAVFLDIAENPGTSVVEVAKRLNMTNAATARNVSTLSDRTWLKKKGLGLIAKEEDPFELRRKILTLTPKGVRLKQQIEALL